MLRPRSIAAALLALFTMAGGAPALAADPFADFPARMKQAPIKQDLELTMTIDSVAGAPGQQVEIPILIQTDDVQPHGIDVNVAFDPDNLSYQGARLGEAVPNGRILSQQFNEGDPEDPEDPPNIGINVFGVDLVRLPDGVVVYLRFSVAAEPTDDVLPLSFLSASAAAVDPTSLEVYRYALTLVDGAVDLQCPQLSAPQSVSASDGLPDGVLVTWSAVDGASEYRVLRGATSNPAAATLITPWQAQTTYMDTSAPAPQGNFGCGEGTVTTFFYWVEARARQGCNSPLSAPDEGSRGTEKAVYEKALPLPSNPAQMTSIQPNSPVFIRLVAPRFRGESTVLADWNDATTAHVHWLPTEEATIGLDGWVRITPERPWPNRATLAFTAWALDEQGEPIAANTAMFQVGGESSAAIASEGRVFVETPGKPSTVFLTLTAPVSGESWALSAFDHQANQWRWASEFEGFLADAPTLEALGDGRYRVAARIQHDARIALRPRSATPRSAQAPGSAGDLALLLVAAGLLKCAPARILVKKLRPTK